MFSTSLSSSIWNPTTYRPSAPAWKYPSSTRTHLENQEYELPTFKHPCLSSPGRRPPVSDVNFGSHNYRDFSPMQVVSPHHGLKMAEKPRTVCSPIVIPDSPSPSVITISSSSDRSNSLDITGKRDRFGHRAQAFQCCVWISTRAAKLYFMICKMCELSKAKYTARNATA